MNVRLRLAAWVLLAALLSACSGDSDDEPKHAEPPQVQTPKGLVTFHDPQACPVATACFFSRLPLDRTVQVVHDALKLSDAQVVVPANSRNLAYEETGDEAGETLTWMVWSHLSKRQPTPAPHPLRRDGYVVVVAWGQR